MKICVTGGAGFIGSHPSEQLLLNGHSVSVIDNLSLGSLSNIAHLQEDKRFKFYQENILDIEKLNEIFKVSQFDTVFHLAATSDIARSFDEVAIDLDNTFLSTYTVLNLMRKYSIPELVFASTSAVYGELQGQIAEDAGPLRPVSHYGAAKLASEAFISSFVEGYGMRAWIARFPNVIGAPATHGVIWDLIRKIRTRPELLQVLGDGEQNKPYMHVRDLVDALLFIWKKSQDKINIFNIGVDTRTKVKIIAEEVVKAMGHDTAIQYTGGSRGWIGDVPTFEYDLSKIKRLGWSPRRSSNEAVKAAIGEIVAQKV
jgi:UDP-glucose 4-epimerase